MITEGIVELMNIYNDTRGFSIEIDDFIEFIKTIDEDIIDATTERKEAYVNKYLEIYCRR